MELQLLENIKKFGYNGELTEATKFMESLKQGQKSPAFTKLVAWIADEIAILNDMDETIHSIVSPDDSSSFLLELSCFLKELGCMNERLMTGNVNERLGTEQDRFALLDFLAAELAASRLIEARNQKASTSMDIEVEESDTAKDLKDMLVALNFEKPPDNITAEKLFSRLEAKLTEVLKTAPRELVGEPLVTNEFTEREWKDLELVQQELHDEYRMRRDMLLKRLDVTVQSFLWSDRVKSREAELTKQYEETRKFLSAEPNITFADLLAARDDIAIMEKTSNASVRKNTRSEINSIIIGEVPDRGGRPYEQEPPPPEMPPWQKDRVPGPSPAGGGRGGGRGGGGYGGGGGGRVIVEEALAVAILIGVEDMEVASEIIKFKVPTVPPIVVDMVDKEEGTEENKEGDIVEGKEVDRVADMEEDKVAGTEENKVADMEEGKVADMEDKEVDMEGRELNIVGVKVVDIAEDKEVDMEGRELNIAGVKVVDMEEDKEVDMGGRELNIAGVKVVDIAEDRLVDMEVDKGVDMAAVKELEIAEEDMEAEITVTIQKTEMEDMVNDTLHRNLRLKVDSSIKEVVAVAEEEKEAEFKEDGIKETIPIIINVVDIIVVEAGESDSTEIAYMKYYYFVLMMIIKKLTSQSIISMNFCITN